MKIQGLNSSSFTFDPAGFERLLMLFGDLFQPYRNDLHRENIYGPTENVGPAENIFIFFQS